MSTGVIELRRAGAPDIDQVERIMGQAFDPRFGEAWTRSQCLGILAMPGVWLTLAELDGAPAGFALARVVVDEAELLLLAVTPAMRRRGIGSTLLRAVAGEALARDGVALHLEVRAGNDAIKLYGGAGFVKVGERRDYYRGSKGQCYSALTLRLRLR